MNWPPLRCQKDVRSFLELTGYYRRFIKGYAIISKALIDLLKKEGFHWNAETEKAFLALKRDMTSAPVLALPDFEKQFIIETDASMYSIGAVLQQGRHPIAFISRKLGPRWQKLFSNEKELLAIVFAIQDGSSILWREPL